MNGYGDIVDRQERPFVPRDDDPQIRGDEFALAYVKPDGTRVFYNRDTTTAQAAADATRLDVLARAQGRHDPEPGESESAALWSRTPTREQLEARDRAFAAFVANLPMWSDEAMPRIDWRWLSADDDPTMARAWGFCRWTGPGHVQIALRVDASPERIYSTTLHESAHAVDHELLRLGAPTALLEQRARHVQRVLGV
jgi:hypothetical protein